MNTYSVYKIKQDRANLELLLRLTALASYPGSPFVHAINVRVPFEPFAVEFEGHAQKVQRARLHLLRAHRKSLGTRLGTDMDVDV